MVCLLPLFFLVLPIASLLSLSCQQQVVLNLSCYCWSSPPHGPLNSPTYLSLALRPSTKRTPPPAPGVSPITPLYLIASHTLRTLDVPACSLPCTFVDVDPLPWDVLFPHLHLANAHLPFKIYFKRYRLPKAFPTPLHPDAASPSSLGNCYCQLRYVNALFFECPFLLFDSKLCKGKVSLLFTQDLATCLTCSRCTVNAKQVI